MDGLRRGKDNVEPVRGPTMESPPGQKLLSSFPSILFAVENRAVRNYFVSVAFAAVAYRDKQFSIDSKLCSVFTGRRVLSTHSSRLHRLPSILGPRLRYRLFLGVWIGKHSAFAPLPKKVFLLGRNAYELSFDRRQIERGSLFRVDKRNIQVPLCLLQSALCVSGSSPLSLELIQSANEF